MRTNRISPLALALLVAGTVPAAVHAQSAGVEALLDQARYWESRGRGDLANQAYRRVLAIDPGNAAARQALAGPTRSTQAPPPAPAPAPAPAPVPAPMPAPERTPVTPAANRPAPAAPADRGGDARAAGFRALNAGDLETAAQRFQSALARNGNDTDALGGLGLVRLRTQRFAEARDLLERASRRGGAAKWAEALASARFFAGMAEAEAAADAGRLDDAQKIAEGLVQSDFSGKAPALDLLGGIYERQGRYADAARLYADAAKQGGTTDKALQARAIRAQALEASASGNNLLAEQLFQRGVMADPKDPWIRYEFARFLEKQGRRADVDSIIGSLGGSPDPEAIYAAALLYSQTDRPSNAEALLRRIPEASRTSEMRDLALSINADSAITRARALAAQGQAAQAATALYQVAETPGLNLASKGALADALFDIGDTAGASRIAQQALSEDAADPQAYESLVRVLAKSGQDAFAMAAVQRASAHADNSPEGQRTMARLNGILAASQSDRLRETGQFAQAFDLLQAQWNAAPGNLEILSALARLYQSGGLNAQAALTFQMVLNRSPSDKAALLGLVDTSSASGNFDRARQAVDRAIALSPNDYNVYLAAARMEQARGDEGAAKRYLRTARAIYIARNGTATGGFSAGNPFAASAARGANPFAAQPQAINPFALGTAQSQNMAMAPSFAIQPQVAQGGYPQPLPGYGQVSNGYAIPPMGMPSAPQAMGAYPSNPAMASPAFAPVTDPVLQTIDRDIRALAAESRPRGDIDTGYRQRSGEVGLSELKELSGNATISTGFAGGRVFAKANAVVIDAGSPTRSGQARFGRNATPEAQGIVAKLPSNLSPVDAQHASGVAFSAGYDGKYISGDVGTTPLGFGKSHVAGGLVATPRLSRYASARIWAERRPVTDSIVAYSGTYDPVSGQFWGAVTKNGGGISLSYDKDGSGVYVDGSLHRYVGTEVPTNQGIQANAGGYLRIYHNSTSRLTAGINANYQRFDNNQNFFTLGHGGYFSPQSFLSVSFPLRYSLNDERVDLSASLVPGYQSYDQEAAPIYPVDTGGQALLDALKLQNSDVRARYDSISNTGFGMSASGSAYYRINQNTRIGGELNLNTFGVYNEFRSLIGIRQQFGDDK